MCANKNEKPYAHISINIILHASNKANDTEKQTYSERFLGKWFQFTWNLFTAERDQRDKGKKKEAKQESFTCK